MSSGIAVIAENEPVRKVVQDGPVFPIRIHSLLEPELVGGHSRDGASQGQ
jgi:hypothetical protein